jgi:hypothetical protein
MHKLIAISLVLFPYIAATSQINNSNTLSISVSNKDQQGKYTKLVNDAVLILNDIMNSEEFKNRVQNFTFDWVDIANGGIGKIENDLVYDTLIRKKNNHIMKLKLTKMGLKYIKFWGSGTIGVTSLYQASTITFLKPWINISPEHYQCTLITYASHLAHEYCHQIGFTDKNYNQASFRNVVPYAIGDIFCDLANDKCKTKCACKD